MPLENKLLIFSIKKQTDFVGKQYRGLNKVFGFDKKEDKTINKEKGIQHLINIKKSNLMYNSKHSFHKYHNIR